MGAGSQLAGNRTSVRLVRRLSSAPVTNNDRLSLGVAAYR
jgi:hypothetical protein